MRLDMTRDVSFQSPLAPDALLERICSAMDPYPESAFSVPDSQKPLLGRVIANGVSARLRPRYFGKNANGAIFTGTVEGRPGGSVIHGQVGPDHTVRGLLWFAFIFGLCWTGVAAILAFIPGTGFGAGGVVAGVGMTLWWVGIVALASIPHWPQRRRLVETLRDVVEGTDARWRTV
jgi:hypothetical protein